MCVTNSSIKVSLFEIHRVVSLSCLDPDWYTPPGDINQLLPSDSTGMGKLMYFKQMCVYTVLNKNKNAWIMHRDIPSQQSVALVSNIACHLQISPLFVITEIFSLGLNYFTWQSNTLTAVYKNSTLFQVRKNSSELSFPFTLCFLTCSPFLLTRRLALCPSVKEFAWSTGQIYLDLLSISPFWMRKTGKRFLLSS